MEENKYIKGGEIVAIPLFLADKEKAKLKKEDFNKNFAFGRCITERAGKILIEIFKETGDLNINIKTVISSGLLMKPLFTIWEGVERKRWKVVQENSNYDKEKESNYNDIELVLGGIDNLRIWHAKDESETPITREELIKGNYQLMAIYDYTQVEDKIIEKLDL